MDRYICKCGKAYSHRSGFFICNCCRRVVNIDLVNKENRQAVEESELEEAFAVMNKRPEQSTLF